ncbi:Veg protein [Lentilactobacillus fungorum]|uniref:Veg protein n=1 Tax=Lentilactobacillus fungorum TaxID=2201250 RepID=A0ABQ3VX61_9LACO|nr:Veg family protein [Lentilactobacillus fungorum]GHP13125.1 Veg protein [Lentilactobacillus fungorum]
MPVTLSVIKHKMDGHIGQHVLVTSQIGRRKTTKRHGILRETFPAIFVVELDPGKSSFERVSYSYTDILTKNIEVDFDVAQAN